jgi:murein DD-endopeptidase MepM/ murein hydrolase activator NlpD
MSKENGNENIPIEEKSQLESPVPKNQTFLKRVGRFYWVGGVIIVLVLVILFWAFQKGAISLPVKAAAQPEETSEMEVIPAELALSSVLPIRLDQLPAYYAGGEKDAVNISRRVNIHTVIAERPRIDIMKYEVQEGDTLFGIGEKFGLKPDTILWGNWYTMGGDPHTLRPGQELNILPVDGVLHVWSLGEGLNGVAKFYGVTAEDIINWPGNNLDPDIDRSHPPIEEGTALVVPNGRREPPSWQMIQITRSNPAVAKVLGPGYCGAVSSGLVGDGVFGWPTTSQWLSGYQYMPGVHEAIDIGGVIGASIFASDDGVVVYSGWNDWGYGYVIVLDHGNGWQTLYAHLSSISAGCGQSVTQGQVIGAMGCTGNCTGPHLHFEMRHEVWGRVNPISILP